MLRRDGAIPFAQFDRCHLNLLQLSCNFQRGFYVSGLSRFITARKHNYHFNATLRKVNTIPRTAMNPRFGNALTHWRAISKISIFCVVDMHLYASFGLRISQSAKPHGQTSVVLISVINPTVLWDTFQQGQDRGGPKQRFWVQKLSITISPHPINQRQPML